METQSINQNEPQVTSSNPVYCKIYSRLAAFLIDSVILTVPFLIFYLITIVIFQPNLLSLQTSISSSNAGPTFSFTAIITSIISSLVLATLSTLYYGLFLSKRGFTLGMQFVGVKTTKEGGELLSLKEASLRNLAYLITPLFIGSLATYIPFVGGLISLLISVVWTAWCIFTPKKQNLYDMIFKNIYVSNNENTTTSKIIIGCCCSFYLIILVAIVSAVIFFGAIFATAFSGLFLNNMNSVPQSSPQQVNLQRIKTESKSTNNESAVLETNPTPNSQDRELFVKSCTNSYQLSIPDATPTQLVVLNNYCGCMFDISANNRQPTMEDAVRCQNEIPENFFNTP